jgi:hypothetical protein
MQISRNWETRCIFRDTTHFRPNKYSEADITGMLSFIVNNIYVFFQQYVAIPVGKNCPPLLVDLFLYS